MWEKKKMFINLVFLIIKWWKYKIKGSKLNLLFCFIICFVNNNYLIL